MLASPKTYLDKIKQQQRLYQINPLPVSAFKNDMLARQSDNKLNNLKITEPQVRECYREIVESLTAIRKSWLAESSLTNNLQVSQSPFEKTYTSYFLSVVSLFPETRNTILDCALHEEDFSHGANSLIAYIHELNKRSNLLPNEINVDFNNESSVLEALKRLHDILSNEQLVEAITCLNHDTSFTIKYGLLDKSNVFISHDESVHPSNYNVNTDHYDYSCRQFYRAACQTKVSRTGLIKVISKMSDYQNKFGKTLTIYTEDPELIGHGETPLTAAGNPALAELLSVDLSYSQLLIDYIHSPNTMTEVPLSSIIFLNQIIKKNELNDATFKLRLAFFNRIQSQFAVEYLMIDYLNAEFEAYLLNGNIEKTAKILVDFYVGTIDKETHLTEASFSIFLSDFIERIERPWRYHLFDNNEQAKQELFACLKKEIKIICISN